MNKFKTMLLTISLLLSALMAQGCVTRISPIPATVTTYKVKSYHGHRHKRHHHHNHKRRSHRSSTIRIY